MPYLDKNIVYSLGLGPGDPELITVKARRILELSDIVIVPQSDETGRSIAKEIILYYVDESKVFMYYFPMNNDKKELCRRYEDLAFKIKGLLDEGRSVSYVTMGDPTIFSTSNYLTEKLIELGIKMMHVPGISSINAASAQIGIPLSVKGTDFAIYELPSHTERIVELIERHETTIFMKVNKRLPLLREALAIAKPQKAYLAHRITLDDEQIYDLLKSSPPQESAYLSLALIKRGKK